MLLLALISHSRPLNLWVNITSFIVANKIFPCHKQFHFRPADPWQDLKEDYGKGGYEHLTGFKITHPHLKVSLAIGGWNEGSKNYSLLVADPEQRRRFVKQVTTFIRKYNFDGLDLDWEYPTQRGGRPQDRENFVLLTKELRDEFDNYGLLLTSAIGAAKNVIDQAYDVRQISRYLDYLHIMCYDYHGSWDKQVGYNAPLRAPEGDVLSVVSKSIAFSTNLYTMHMVYSHKKLSIAGVYN